jgi:hypothetical protein
MRIRRRIGELHQFQFALAVEHHAAHRFLRLFLLVGGYWTGKRDRPRTNEREPGELDADWRDMTKDGRSSETGGKGRRCRCVISLTGGPRELRIAPE